MNPTTPSKSEPARIPDLMSEQDLATLTRNREHLLAKAQSYVGSDALRSQDEKVHLQLVADQVHATRMGEEMAEYFEAAAKAPHQCDKSAAYLNRLAGYARQLEALALAELESVTA